jgi:hypothetical protein
MLADLRLMSAGQHGLKLHDGETDASRAEPFAALRIGETRDATIGAYKVMVRQHVRGARLFIPGSASTRSAAELSAAGPEEQRSGDTSSGPPRSGPLGGGRAAEMLGALAHTGELFEEDADTPKDVVNSSRLVLVQIASADSPACRGTSRVGGTGVPTQDWGGSWSSTADGFSLGPNCDPRCQPLPEYLKHPPCGSGAAPSIAPGANLAVQATAGPGAVAGYVRAPAAADGGAVSFSITAATGGLGTFDIGGATGRVTVGDAAGFGRASQRGSDDPPAITVQVARTAGGAVLSTAEHRITVTGAGAPPLDIDLGFGGCVVGCPRRKCLSSTSITALLTQSAGSSAATAAAEAGLAAELRARVPALLKQNREAEDDLVDAPTDDIEGGLKLAAGQLKVPLSASAQEATSAQLAVHVQAKQLLLCGHERELAVLMEQKTSLLQQQKQRLLAQAEVGAGGPVDSLAVAQAEYATVRHTTLTRARTRAQLLPNTPSSFPHSCSSNCTITLRRRTLLQPTLTAGLA